MHRTAPAAHTEKDCLGDLISSHFTSTATSLGTSHLLGPSSQRTIFADVSSRKS